MQKFIYFLSTPKIMPLELNLQESFELSRVKKRTARTFAIGENNNIYVATHVGKNSSPEILILSPNLEAIASVDIAKSLGHSESQAPALLSLDANNETVYGIYERNGIIAGFELDTETRQIKTENVPTPRDRVHLIGFADKSVYTIFGGYETIPNTSKIVVVGTKYVSPRIRLPKDFADAVPCPEGKGIYVLCCGDLSGEGQIHFLSYDEWLTGRVNSSFIAVPKYADSQSRIAVDKEGEIWLSYSMYKGAYKATLEVVEQGIPTKSRIRFNTTAELPFKVNDMAFDSEGGLLILGGNYTPDNLIDRINRYEVIRK